MLRNYDFIYPLLLSPFFLAFGMYFSKILIVLFDLSYFMYCFISGLCF